MGRKPRSGAAMLQELRGQCIVVCQYLQEQYYDNGEPETEDASFPQSNGDNSLMGQKFKSAGAAIVERQRGQPNAVAQDLQEQNYDNREPETEDASSSLSNGVDSLMDQKRKRAKAGMLQRLRGQLNAVHQDLQEQNYDNMEPETEDASSPQFKRARAVMLHMLRGQSNAVPQDLPEQNYDNREPEIEDASSPQSNDDNFFAHSSPTKAIQQKNCDPLLVKIIGKGK